LKNFSTLLFLAIFLQIHLQISLTPSSKYSLPSVDRQLLGHFSRVNAPSMMFHIFLTYRRATAWAKTKVFCSRVLLIVHLLDTRNIELSRNRYILGIQTKKFSGGSYVIRPVIVLVHTPWLQSRVAYNMGEARAWLTLTGLYGVRTANSVGILRLTKLRCWGRRCNCW
jgi:hypothetical protein